MTRWTQTLQSISKASLVGVVALSAVGCSAYRTSHVVEPEPAVSPNAVASADGSFVAEPFSLVAADSIGLATFGAEIARDNPTTDGDRLVGQ